MYHFPNLDKSTRLIMLTELELDEKKGLFYPPACVKPEYLPAYKRHLKTTITKGSVEWFQQQLAPFFFRAKDKSGRKIPSNIAQTLAFSDFNRYYVRAILVRAIDEGKAVYVYRAKQVKNERRESTILINHCYFNRSTLQGLLYQIRDYRILFSNNSTVEFMQPNSGLSLRLG